MTIKNIKIDLLEKQSKTNLPFKINKKRSNGIVKKPPITKLNIDLKTSSNNNLKPKKKISKDIKSNILLGKQMSPKQNKRICSFLGNNNKHKTNISLGKQMSPKNCKPNIFLEKKSPKKCKANIFLEKKSPKKCNPDIVLYETNQKKIKPVNNKVKPQKKIPNYYQIKKHYKFKQKEKLKNIRTNLLEKGIIQSNNCPDKLVKEINWLIDDNKIHITKINE